jgi:hypothetical protein
VGPDNRERLSQPIDFVEDHMVLAERACLDALRSDGGRWGGIVTQELFTGPRVDLWSAITKVEDPRDSLQIFDWVVENQTRLASSESWGPVIEELVHPDYEMPFILRGEVWIQARLEMLQRRRDRKRIELALSESAEWLREGVPTDEIEAYIDHMMAKQTINLGIFREIEPYTDSAADEVPSERSLVRGVVYPRGVSILAGPGGIGKSWLALEMARGVAQERFWLGLPCELANVAYLSLEMTAAQVRRRIRMLGGLESKRLFIVGSDQTGGSFEIADPAKCSALRFWITQRDIDLLIVDPLRNAHSADENDSTEIARVLAAFSRLGCAVLLLHHVAKGSGESRGSSAIRDRADAVLTVSPREATLVIRWEKKPRFEAVTGEILCEMLVHSDRNRMEIRRLS